MPEFRSGLFRGGQVALGGRSRWREGLRCAGRRARAGGGACFRFLERIAGLVGVPAPGARPTGLIPPEGWERVSEVARVRGDLLEGRLGHLGDCGSPVTCSAASRPGPPATGHLRSELLALRGPPIFAPPESVRMKGSRQHLPMCLDFLKFLVF